MKQITRHNVFETNSSSTHSLTWSLDRKGLKPFKKSTTVQFGEYGWEIDTYDTVEQKLSYLFTMIASQNGMTYLDQHRSTFETEEQYRAVCLDGFKRFKNLSVVKMIQEIYLNYTNRSLKIAEPNWKKFYPYGYIDHQSSDNLDTVLQGEHIKDALLNYIFNDKVIVYTDNDNY